MSGASQQPSPWTTPPGWDRVPPPPPRGKGSGVLVAVVLVVLAVIGIGTAGFFLVEQVLRQTWHTAVSGEKLPDEQARAIERELSTVTGVSGVVVTFAPYNLDWGPARFTARMTTTSAPDRQRLRNVLTSAMPVVCRVVPPALDPLIENGPPQIEISVSNLPSATTTAGTATGTAATGTAATGTATSAHEATLTDLGFPDEVTLTDLHAYCRSGAPRP